MPHESQSLLQGSRKITHSIGLFVSFLDEKAVTFANEVNPCLTLTPYTPAGMGT